MKLDFPVMQIDELYNTMLTIKNTKQKDMRFEFFLPEHEICGLKMTPMTEVIKADESIEINIEY